MKNINWAYVGKVFLFFILIMGFYQAWFFTGVVLLLAVVGIFIIVAEIAFVILLTIIYGLTLFFKRKLEPFGWAVLIASVLFLITNALWVFVLWPKSS